MHAMQLAFMTAMPNFQHTISAHAISCPMQIMDPAQDPADGTISSIGGHLCLMPLDVLGLISTKLWRRNVAKWRMAHTAFACVPLPGLVSRALARKLRSSIMTQ